MQKDSRFFDDFAKLASGAASTLGDMKRDIENIVMEKVEKILHRMNLVRREEFEVVRQIAEKARLEQEKLAQELQQIKELLKAKAEKSPKHKD